MIIRDWRIDDLVSIRQLNQANLPHLSSLTLKQLKALVNQACYCRVLELDNGFAGFVLALLPSANYNSENLHWFKQHYQNFLYVDRIAIETFAQGKGCGKGVYQDLENYCEKNGIASIALEVNIKPRNQGSLDFHQKMGFVEVGRQDTSGGTKTVALMLKEMIT